MNNSTTIRAPADGRFLLRFLLIGLACLGFCAYCLYDGLYAYPKHRLEPVLAYAELEKEGKTDRWIEVAQENGWDEAKPKKSVEEVHADIIWQYVMAVISVLFAIPILGLYFRARWSWIEGTATGINTSWGVAFDYDQIEQIDKKRWEKKGIARILYQSDGNKKWFVLDDFKYQRQPADAIMARIESLVAPERIINDQTSRDIPDADETSPELGE
ncbi:MAG TPA: hypothetical protein PKD54_06105 [Pirellulaceae bacterium]|nr:hypothetical protein [Pirellulaceae bacterium]